MLAEAQSMDPGLATVQGQAAEEVHLLKICEISSALTLSASSSYFHTAVSFDCAQYTL